MSSPLEKAGRVGGSTPAPGHLVSPGAKTGPGTIIHGFGRFDDNADDNVPRCGAQCPSDGIRATPVSVVFPQMQRMHRRVATARVGWVEKQFDSRGSGG